jgi:hypothetical protein
MKSKLWVHKDLLEQLIFEDGKAIRPDEIFWGTKEELEEQDADLSQWVSFEQSK